jgi:hypothetical protein
MATTTTDVVAVNSSTTAIGDNGTATIQAGTIATPNTNSATGTTVEGTAYVTADTQQQVGSLDSTITIGNGGSVSVSEVSTTTASATNVGGAGPIIAEVDTISFAAAGAITAGQTYSITVNGTTYTTAALTAPQAAAADGVAQALKTALLVGAPGTPIPTVVGIDLVLTADVGQPAYSPGFTASQISQAGGPSAGAITSTVTETIPGSGFYSTATAKYSGNTGAILDVVTPSTTADVTIGNGGVVSATPRPRPVSPPLVMPPPPLNSPQAATASWIRVFRLEPRVKSPPTSMPTQ